MAQQYLFGVDFCGESNLATMAGTVYFPVNSQFLLRNYLLFSRPHCSELVVFGELWGLKREHAEFTNGFYCSPQT